MDQLSRAKIIVPVLLAAVVLFSVPAFTQQGAAIERGLQAGTGAGVEQVLTQSTDIAGEWVVRITTTHLKESYIRRNGPMMSDQAKATEWISRHGDYLTITTYIEDPQYLEEPFIQSVTYQWEPHTELEYFPCTIVNENISDKIPHFLPGKNPWLKEFSEQEGLPYEATRGGAETMYPEYRTKMKNMKVAPFIKSSSGLR